MTTSTTLTPIGVPRDIIENDNDIFLTNYCIGFSEMNEKANRKKPINVCLVATKEPTDMKFTEFKEFNNKYSRPFIKSLVEGKFKPVGCSVIKHTELQTTTYFVVEDGCREQYGIYVNGESFQYDF